VFFRADVGLDPNSCEMMVLIKSNQKKKRILSSKCMSSILVYGSKRNLKVFSAFISISAGFFFSALLLELEVKW
jgi:hypothetical protein